MAKRKVIIKSCGNCHICGKEHMSNEGGWVINAEKLNFCHSLDHSCYDIYFNNVRTAEKQKVVINTENDKRMNMYIEYLKSKNVNINMPLNKKGKKILAAMEKEYGKDKGKAVFYASENKGTIKGVKGKMVKGFRSLLSI